MNYRSVSHPKSPLKSRSDLRRALTRVSAAAAMAMLLGNHSARAGSDAFDTAPTATGGVANFTGNFTLGTTAPAASGTGTPASGDALYFGTSSTTTLNDDLAAGTSFASFTFNTGASAFTIGGNSFVLTGNVTNNSTNLQTINNAISATAVRTFTMTAGGGDITLGGAFTGTGGGITTAGAGTLTLSAAGNSYTGATTVATGTTLNIASGGSVSTSNLTMSNGANFNIAGNLTNTAAAGGSVQKIRGNVTQTAGAVNVNGLDLADTAGDTASYYLGGSGSVTTGAGTYSSLAVGGRGVSSFYLSGNSNLTVNGSTESQTSNSNAFQLTVGSVFPGPTAGTSTFVQQGGTVTTNGLSLGGSQGAVTPGIYYLNGGTLTSGTLTRGSNASSSGTLSFGGGTFKNSAAISR